MKWFALGVFLLCLALEAVCWVFLLMPGVDPAARLAFALNAITFVVSGIVWFRNWRDEVDAA